LKTYSNNVKNNADLKQEKEIEKASGQVKRQMANRASTISALVGGCAKVCGWNVANEVDGKAKAGKFSAGGRESAQKKRL